MLTPFEFFCFLVVQLDCRSFGVSEILFFAYNAVYDISALKGYSYRVDVSHSRSLNVILQLLEVKPDIPKRFFEPEPREQVLVMRVEYKRIFAVPILSE